MQWTLDTAGARALDQRITESGIEEFCLMMRASRVAADHLLSNEPTSVVCLAGPGNNGGDAYGVAAHLLLSGIPTLVVAVAEPKGAAQKAQGFYRDLGGTLCSDLDQVSSTDWIVDGVLGTGCDRAPEGNISVAISWICARRVTGSSVLALDIPSGLNASTGVAYQPSVAADLTVSFLAPKTGLLTGDGPSLCGQIQCESLKPWDVSEYDYHTRLIGYDTIDVPEHRPTAHKGTRGSVLVIGGRNGMEGAGQLSALASLRAGSGKVFWATDSSLLEVPELVRIEWSIETILDCAKRVSTIVIGPGLGHNVGDVISAVWALKKPLVVDADALNWLSENSFPNRDGPWIGTPHPLEASRLTGAPMTDRFHLLDRLENVYSTTWILKGAGTLVSGNPVWLNPVSDWTLGTAGSGDVLAGIVASLWAQGSTSPASTGVWLHAQAFLAAKKLRGSDVIASDAVNQLGSVRTA
ncbi:MAG: hypothetical protein CMD99_02550 [Gammaproteobacteria bacterium]|nr:hypothetical protein [Gammaproteobacteria bacterium]|tara:strand:+ start:1413 stop:2813 length:1401 start_codon:yes stop_codon:yes gene_type:complete